MPPRRNRTVPPSAWGASLASPPMSRSIHAGISLIQCTRAHPAPAGSLSTARRCPPRDRAASASADATMALAFTATVHDHFPVAGAGGPTLVGVRTSAGWSAPHRPDSPSPATTFGKTPATTLPLCPAHLTPQPVAARTRRERRRGPIGKALAPARATTTMQLHRAHSHREVTK